MNNIPKNLEQIGFEQRLLETVDLERLEKFEIARVIAVHKDSYTLSNGVVDVLAELVGKIIFRGNAGVKSLSLTVVADRQNCRTSK